MSITTPRDWLAIAKRLQADPSGLIPLREAAGLLRATASAVYRWVMHGKDGYCLEAVYVGRGWLTTREACARFVAAVSAGVVAAPPDRGPQAPAGASPAAVERRARRAVEELERLRGAGARVGARRASAI